MFAEIGKMVNLFFYEYYCRNINTVPKTLFYILLEQKKHWSRTFLCSGILQGKNVSEQSLAAITVGHMVSLWVAYIFRDL